MKIETSDIIRWVFTIIILVFIWRGDLWAIKLSITLTAIALELIGFILNRID